MLTLTSQLFHPPDDVAISNRMLLWFIRTIKALGQAQWGAVSRHRLWALAVTDVRMMYFTLKFCLSYRYSVNSTHVRMRATNWSAPIVWTDTYNESGLKKYYKKHPVSVGLIVFAVGRQVIMSSVLYIQSFYCRKREISYFRIILSKPILAIIKKYHHPLGPHKSIPIPQLPTMT